MVNKPTSSFGSCLSYDSLWIIGQLFTSNEGAQQMTSPFLYYQSGYA
ncbi:hypothetical protein X798_04460 [Onchocerca flexuosa]|uniref:Uncharacterized protein n=1 Tax=Onchocerca flexuosa TaxID=387005 RepID=A0A238BUE3_9BILA|nr:hypothetical protein X798_04460 [Onchocerca flexuosa]